MGIRVIMLFWLGMNIVISGGFLGVAFSFIDKISKNTTTPLDAISSFLMFLVYAGLTVLCWSGFIASGNAMQDEILQDSGYDI